MNSVLIIDDDKKLCALMKKCVEQENLSAVVAHGGLEGLRLLEKNKDTCSILSAPSMAPSIIGRYSSGQSFSLWLTRCRCSLSSRMISGLKYRSTGSPQILINWIITGRLGIAP